MPETLPTTATAIMCLLPFVGVARGGVKVTGPSPCGGPGGITSAMVAHLVGFHQPKAVHALGMSKGAPPSLLPRCTVGGAAGCL